MNPRLRIAIQALWNRAVWMKFSKPRPDDAAQLRADMVELIQAARGCNDDATKAVNEVTR